MRVAPCLLLAACVCLAPAGCANFGKRAATSDRAQAGGAAAPAKADTGDPLVRQTAAQEQYGMLAGRVLDLGTGRPVDAAVRWECLDDPKEQPGDVAASGGYFTIQGRRPGKQYKLTARAKQGDRVLAGVTYVTAPSVVVLIKLSEGFANPGTPPPPGPPTATEDKGLKKTGAAERQGWQPGVGSIAVPRPEDARPAQPQGGFVPNLVDIPNPARPRPDPAQQVAPPPPPAIPMGAATPPSCNLVGDRLYNLALREVGGDPWEWRTNRRGKLVLLDFWYSSCVPCQAAIYHMKALQGQYGFHGLEVVGIACEKDGTPQEQAYRVAKVAQRLETNYRLLLASGRHNPVPDQFGVRVFPTLFLLDESGMILWRHEGGLRAEDLEVLHREISTRLGVRRQ